MSGKAARIGVDGVIALTRGSLLVVPEFGSGAVQKQAAPQHSQAFGALRAVIDTVDFLDPQQAYTGQAWWAMWNVYETLITYRHVDGPGGYKLVPGLAQSMPTVSGNGTIYKFTLRKGLRYSDGTRMKAS